MTKLSKTKPETFWRADWFAGVAVVIAALLLQQLTDFIGTLERRFYDFASTSASRPPLDRIAVIAIDDQSIANIGRWPWPRNVHAELIDKLSAAKTKTIVHTVFFFEPQLDAGLPYIRKIKEALGASLETGAVHEQIGQLIEQAESKLDTDALLAASIKNAGNVLLPSVFALGEQRGQPDSELPDYAVKSALDENSGFSTPATRSQQPMPALGQVASGIGHLNQLNDVDGAIRQEPLLVSYNGKAVPSMALLAATKSLNLQVSDIKFDAGSSVQIGKLKIVTDDAARMLPQFYKRRDGKPAFEIGRAHV